jgi:histidine ammonia-lyase
MRPHATRGRRGQSIVAAAFRSLLEESDIWRARRDYFGEAGGLPTLT